MYQDEDEEFDSEMPVRNKCDLDSSYEENDDELDEEFSPSDEDSEDEDYEQDEDDDEDYDEEEELPVDEKSMHLV